MDADDVYPTEMPNHPPSPIPALDDDTAERLLSGRLDPDDAPPGYAGVARLLQTAAAPPHPDELAGQEAALALFRAAWTGPAEVGGHRSGRVRGRLVAVALAGVLVAGGAATGEFWTTGGAPSSRGAEPGSVAGSGGSGLLRPSGPAVVTERERAVARHRGGGGSRGGGAAHGTKPVRAPEANGSKAKVGKPEKPKAEKPRAQTPKAQTPKAQKPAPKGPKATPSQDANRARGERR